VRHDDCDEARCCWHVGGFYASAFRACSSTMVIAVVKSRDNPPGIADTRSLSLAPVALASAGVVEPGVSWQTTYRY
jgi:hypothetical protein